MLLLMKNICKSFFDNEVLKNVNFELQSGEIHALIGANGAGKSTLMNILMGVIKADQGDILIHNESVIVDSPIEANRYNIAIIPQEPNLVPNLSIYENVFLGYEPLFLGSFINKRKMKLQTKKVLKTLGYFMNPNKLVKYLSVSEQQLVSIAKALSHQCKILIMDEPTASLSEYECENLFKLMRSLKNKGVGIIYITHKLKEIHKVCDRVTILRDGKHIITSAVSRISEKEMIKHLVGRELSHYFPPKPTEIGEEVLRVENISCAPWFQNISFKLHKGEILGIAGIVGSGKSEIAKSIFGQLPYTSGAIIYKNKKVSISKPSQAIKSKLGFVNENRTKEGLFLDMSISKNLTISHLQKMNIFQFVRAHEERYKVLEKMIDLDIKAHDLKQKVKYLSGGNQQKVLLGKWLVADSDIYILEEPTRGMDISSKSELYVILRQLVADGKSIIILSSDFSELAGLSNRVVVINQGKLASELQASQITEEAILQHASNIH